MLREDPRRILSPWRYVSIRVEVCVIRVEERADQGGRM